MSKPIIIRRYRTDRDYENDASLMARQGYRVQSAAKESPRPGCLRIVLTGGLGLIFFRPKPVWVVTYTPH